jgi:hypothetical protein
MELYSGWTGKPSRANALFTLRRFNRCTNQSDAQLERFYRCNFVSVTGIDEPFLRKYHCGPERDYGNFI